MTRSGSHRQRRRRQTSQRGLEAAETRQDVALCQYTSGSSPRCLLAYQDWCTPSGRVLKGGDLSRLAGRQESPSDA